MSCSHFVYHFVILTLFMICIFLAMWVAFAEGDKANNTYQENRNWNQTPTPSHRVRREVDASCDRCIVQVKQGLSTVLTLIHSNIVPTPCPQKSYCIFNKTQYVTCTKGLSFTCHNPALPTRYNISIWAGIGIVKGPPQAARLWYVNHTVVTKAENWAITFDVCGAMSKKSFRGCGHRPAGYNNDHKYLCTRYPPLEPSQFPQPCIAWEAYQKTVWRAICSHTNGGYRGCYNPLNVKQRLVRSFVRQPNSNKVTIELEKNHPPMETYGIGIDGYGLDPLTHITIKVQNLEDVQRIEWSVYDHLAKLETKASPLISDKARNLFMEFAEQIAFTLGVKNCFVCGGTNMGEQWPWEVHEADPEYLNNQTKFANFTFRNLEDPVVWTLTTNIVGTNCFFRNGSIPVGTLLCRGQWERGQWVSPTNESAPVLLNHTFFNYLRRSSLNWTAPQGMYWVCGSFAYEYVPPDWSGACVLGWIKPSFFLLPLTAKQTLGAPVYDNWGRKKRDVPSEGYAGIRVGNWKDDEWPPERIIAYYDPATWAEDGSWGYRTPIYMLNRIIRLQAVLELGSRRISAALTILATAQDKLRTAVYQNRLALDYLLAKEGGVCGKFNLTNCCLEIDETGKVVADLTKELHKLVHVPVQKWTGIVDEGGFLGGIFRNWKQAAFMFGIILLGLLLLPCLIPLLRNLIQSTVEGMVDKRTIHLVRYKALPTMDVPDPLAITLSSEEDDFSFN
ncbi:endogenous retrovirus group 3 member 1 Env polyprotein-like [Crotalus tigris]|uniref:endogenous retrovirus group 3 member 1 Env polyprotein-like n=1 Tax=Crotalus tigris TaxID=88082 RepID=UPI00192F2CFD|nr:endogenous retrovirus group 3 member 1 Env polyprotein-like [Crotalus tigris]